ncbi:ATP-binding cassette domain-containing protein [Pseudacidovorax intermedius]|mgnify:CR=1 FL=1|uniref:ATP-binding cassette domain-containing protein n=1 Tax=Pseudacidovorax intermedius TaxID=433924 RepID=UPI0026E9BC31|nr:ATP-binding cassette domain-containing protein [Pseudacidovorax intermedius]
MNNGNILLDVKDVNRRFGGLQALGGVSFDVRRGEILALIGPNGAGKSTLLSVVAGAIRADTGTVTFKGERIDGLAAEQVNRRGLVRTFQGAEVLRQMTVLENVMAAGVSHAQSGILSGMLGFGRAAEVGRQLSTTGMEKLQVVGLERLANANAALLTAGQQRLLSIARALATGAELLILDEPAAGLNTLEKRVLAEVITRIRAKGATVVFVEHDLAFVSQLAERMVVLHHGRVIAKGVPEEVREDPAVIEAYLGNTELNAARAAVEPVGDRPVVLTVGDLRLRYGGLTALDGVRIEVREGEIVALIGANGAGKSTLLNAIAGTEKPQGGTITFGGKDLAPLGKEARTGAGISLAPEGRALFAALTVHDNLLMGRYARVRQSGVTQLLWPRGSARAELDAVLEEVLDFFPRLRERLHQQAGTLSGGEQQMLAIGRALMNRPTMLMLDEPSFGLAPQVSREILGSLVRLAAQGMTVLLVEQNARSALQVADRAYILVNGRIVADGPSQALLNRPDITQAYLGWESEPRSAHDDAPLKAAA